MRSLLVAHRPKLVIEVHDGVDRTCLLDELQAVGYTREFTAVDPKSSTDTLVSDRSYWFS